MSSCRDVMKMALPRCQYIPGFSIREKGMEVGGSWKLVDWGGFLKNYIVGNWVLSIGLGI